MALIKCPECNREISDKAKSCPHCGYPLTTDDVPTRNSTNDSKKVDSPEEIEKSSHNDETNLMIDDTKETENSSSPTIDHNEDHPYIYKEDSKEEKTKKSKRPIPKSAKIAGIALSGIVVIGCIVYVATGNIRKYNRADDLSNDQQYKEAMEIYASLDDYENSKENYQSNAYQYCKQLMNNHDYKSAIDVASQISDYKDAKNLWTESVYEYANQLFKNKKYEDALEYYQQIPTYSDVPQCVKKTEHSINVQNDKTAPVIYGIEKDQVIEVDYNSTFNIQDYLEGIITIEDNVSGDITDFTISAPSEIMNDDRSLKTNTPGEYDFSVKATDEAGNVGSVAFVVKIDDTIYVTTDNPNPVVYEGEYGKVTLQTCTYKSNWGNPLYEFEFLIENQSNNDLGIVFSDVYIGDYAVNTYGSAGSVEPGRQGVEDTSFWDKDIPEDKKNFTEAECIFSLRQGFYGSILYERRMIISRDVIQ